MGRCHWELYVGHFESLPQQANPPTFGLYSQQNPVVHPVCAYLQSPNHLNPTVNTKNELWALNP